VEIKTSIEGVLIYLAMAAYLAAATMFFMRRKRDGFTLFIGGFVFAAVAFVYRWINVDHIPLQNMFEVFLCLGMIVFPLSYFCLRFLRVGGVAADAIIGFITLFPAGFVFDEEPQLLPPALQSHLFLPHVASYMISYMLMAKAAVLAVRQMTSRDECGEAGLVSYETATYKTVRLGFPLLTLGLVLGAVWGKIAWGDYWNWDPKELWSLVSWLIFVFYFHFRFQYRRLFPRVGSALVVAGMAAIVITLLWVNLSRIFPGMHSYAT
jgi:ABC-type transport system involved in cytochrome c biogenesis permease subunit